MFGCVFKPEVEDMQFFRVYGVVGLCGCSSGNVYVKVPAASPGPSSRNLNVLQEERIFFRP